MKAIILNAGEGRRLRPLTISKPKCLLKLNKVTILEHQLTNIAKSGIKEVIMVVGYHANQIIEKVKEMSLNLKFKFIFNPIYYKTNTVYSLWLARDFFKECDFLYFNGDVVFHKDILERLLGAHYDTCVAVKRTAVGEEEVKVILKSEIVKGIGKEIDWAKASGEFIGIARFSKSFNSLFIDKLKEVVNQGMINEFFEVALNRTLKSYNVYAVDVSDLPCIEVDTYEDFNVAKRIYSEIFKEKQKA